MVKTSYEIIDSKTSQPFPSVRGEREVEAEVLSYRVEEVDDDKETVGLTEKRHLGDFITKWGLQRHHDDFPPSWGEIESRSRELPGPYAMVNEIADGRYTGIRYTALVAAIQILYDGSKSFYAQDLTIWSPNRPIDGTDAPGSGPWVIESKRVPEDWIEHRAFGGQEKFAEIVEQSDEDREQVIDWACEEIDGVLALIAPDFPSTDDVVKIEDDSEVDMDAAIEAYKEETGDVNLEDEDSLDKFLESRDVL